MALSMIRGPMMQGPMIQGPMIQDLRSSLQATARLAMTEGDWPPSGPDWPVQPLSLDCAVYRWRTRSQSDPTARQRSRHRPTTRAAIVQLTVMGQVMRRVVGQEQQGPPDWLVGAFR